jgi:hypothetical protein
MPNNFWDAVRRSDPVGEHLSDADYEEYNTARFIKSSPQARFQVLADIHNALTDEVTRSNVTLHSRCRKMDRIDKSLRLLNR